MINILKKVDKLVIKDIRQIAFYSQNIYFIETLLATSFLFFPHLLCFCSPGKVQRSFYTPNLIDQMGKLIIYQQVFL